MYTGELLYGRHRLKNCEICLPQNWKSHHEMTHLHHASQKREENWFWKRGQKIYFLLKHRYAYGT